VFIIVGNLRAWDWVNALWFRVAHLAAIAIVVAEAWFGAVCPLTSLEMWLRARARATTYAGTFIEHWLQRILYYQAPVWVFTLGYTLFGLIVVATWWYFPPRFDRSAPEVDV
jgi:polyferredoxin